MESMPFTGTDEIHMRAPTCKYADSKSGFNDMVGIEIRYRQGNLAVFFYFLGGGGILASLPSPWEKGDRVSGARVLANRRLEMLFLSRFHAVRTLSGSLCSSPSPWGKAYDTGYAFLSFVFMPARVLLLLAILQSRFPVCKQDFSLRSK